jgi:hypothetical protein
MLHERQRFVQNDKGERDLAGLRLREHALRDRAWAALPRKRLSGERVESAPSAS